MLTSLLAVSVCTIPIETITRFPNTSCKHLKLRTEGSTRCVVLCDYFSVHLGLMVTWAQSFTAAVKAWSVILFPTKTLHICATK